MGFINPLLYALDDGEGIRDITEGGSIGCNGKINFPPWAVSDIPGSAIVPFASWNATKGWDPVTGVGVPNFGDLLDSAMTVEEWGQDDGEGGDGGDNGDDDDDDEDEDDEEKKKR